MERASRKRKQKRETNMKMFDQYIKEVRGTDHHTEQETRSSAASFQRTASKSSSQLTTPATSTAALWRQQTHVTEAVLTG